MEHGEPAVPRLARIAIAHQLKELKRLAHVVDVPLRLRLPELKQASKPCSSRRACSAFEKGEHGQHTRWRHVNQSGDEIARQLRPEQLGKPGLLRRGGHRTRTTRHVDRGTAVDTDTDAHCT